VLQQVYEWFAARQWEPPFWPLTVSDDPEWWRRRDLIAPTDGLSPAGAVLPWLWWGLSGREACAVWAGRETLREHGEALARAADAADAATRQRVAVAFDAAITLAGLIPGGGAVGSAVKTAVGVADNLSTATALPGRARAAFTSKQSRYDQALRNEAARRFAGTPDVVEDMKEQAAWAAAIAAVVPVVVVVDDADGLDDISIAFLDALARSSGGTARVLLILAVNTDHHPTHPDVVLPRDVNQDLDHNPRLHEMLSSLASQHRVTTIDLPSLTPGELTQLARKLLDPLPQILDEDALAAVVTAADGRPGRLATLLAHRAVRAAVLNGGTVPPLRSLTARTATTEAFTALPEAVRVALATAAVAGPSMPAAWLRRDHLDQVRSCGWTRRYAGAGENAVVAFTSRSLYEAAYNQIPSVLTPDEIQHARFHLIEHLHPLTLPTEEAPPWPIEVITSILDTLATTGPGASGIPPELVAAWLRLQRAAGLDTVSAALLEQIAAGATGPLLTATAEALYDLGAGTRAVDLFTRQLARLDIKYPPTRAGRDPRTWSALHNLAAATAALGNAAPDATHRIPLYQNAIRLYTELLRYYQTAHQQTPSRRYPDTAMDLAELYHQLSDPRGALHRAKQAHAAYERVLGPEHPDTLSTRHNLAFWRGEAGDAAGAVAAFAELLPIRERVLGPEHPDTLSTRHNLASWRGEAGDAAGAVAAFAELLPILKRVLGPEHPGTLSTRHNLASWRGEAGDAAGAVAALAELLPILKRVLGPEHPGTLSTRHNLASWRGRAGDAAGAVAAFAELLPILKRVLGPEHPDTLSTRHSLAQWRGRAGDAAGAVAAFAELLPIQERVLGPEHPDTLSTRHNLASWRGEAGDAAGAVAAFAELLPIRERVLGPEHPDTLSTRHNLASWRGWAGDAAGAVAALAELLPILKRGLGPEHPDTLSTRHNLAQWRGWAGDAAGAVAALAELLPIRERVLGPEHPDTLSTRHNLAHWRGEPVTPDPPAAPGSAC